MNITQFLGAPTPLAIILGLIGWLCWLFGGPSCGSRNSAAKDAAAEEELIKEGVTLLEQAKAAATSLLEEADQQADDIIASAKRKAATILRAARDEAATASEAAWPPLASSPTGLTAFARCLGVDTSVLRFDDVLGLEPELLSMLPAPCVAMILLYPTSTAAQAHLDSLAAAATTPSRERDASSLLFLRQLRGGTCGTVATLHALVNGARAVASSQRPKGSQVHLDQHLDQSSSSRLLGQRLCEDLLLLHAEGEASCVEDAGELCARRSRALLASRTIRAAHDESAVRSRTNQARTGERQGRHFVTLVPLHGRLMLLDGRRDAPIDCGITTSAQTFLADAAGRVRALIAAAGSAEESTEAGAQLAFSLVALLDCSSSER